VPAVSDVAIQDLYPADVAHCYGCGRDNAHGHRIKTFWRGAAGVARFTPQPYHLSMPGFVYGGLIASLVDCHAIGTAAAERVAAAGGDFAPGAVPRYVTGSLAVRFLKPTPIGGELELVARVREAGERKSIVDVEVSAAGVVTATGEVVAVRMPESMRR
jgi:acyl-coenzyme A thioesterase PaaI-like protein